MIVGARAGALDSARAGEIQLTEQRVQVEGPGRKG